jgi:hypothetical protein
MVGLGRCIYIISHLIMYIFFWFTNWELDLGNNEYVMLDVINIAKYQIGIHHGVALRG